MLDKKNLNHTVFSKHAIKFDKKFSINGIVVEYALGCKSYWLGRYYYIFRAHFPDNRVLTFYILPSAISQPTFSIHLEGELLSFAQSGQKFISNEDKTEFPTLADILNIGSRGIFAGNNFIWRIPNYSLDANHKALPSLHEELIGKFLETFINLEKEISLFKEKYKTRPLLTTKDDGKINAIPFISKTNLELPLECEFKSTKFNYVRINHNDNSSKDFFICQLKANKTFLTFIIKPKNWIITECVVKIRTSTTLKLAYNVIDPTEFIEVEKHFPNLCMFARHDCRLTLFEKEVTMKAGNSYFPSTGNKIPTAVLNQLPDFIEKMILAEKEATLFANTPFFKKAFNRYVARKKAKDDRAATTGLLLLAKLIINIGDFDICPNGDTNADIPGSDFNGDLSTDGAITNMETTDTTPASDIADSGNVSPTDISDAGRQTTGIPMQPSLGPKPGFMFSNPYDNGLDASMLHDLGIIDDNGYQALQSLEDRIDAMHQKTQVQVSSLISDCEADRHSIDMDAQNRYDAADMEQQEALRLRDDAIARGDMDEIGRQTDRARKLQYAKETFKDTANYHSDIEVRAGLRKP